jgi:hypothetical protein
VFPDLNPSDNHTCPDFPNDLEEADGSHVLQLRVARDLGEGGENMILSPDGYRLMLP